MMRILPVAIGWRAISFTGSDFIFPQRPYMQKQIQTPSQTDYREVTRYEREKTRKLTWQPKWWALNVEHYCLANRKLQNYMKLRKKQVRD